MLGFHSANAPVKSGLSQLSNNLGFILIVFLFGNEVLFLGAAMDDLIEHYAHLTGASAMGLRIVIGAAIVGAIALALRAMLRPIVHSDLEDAV